MKEEQIEQLKARRNEIAAKLAADEQARLKRLEDAAVEDAATWKQNLMSRLMIKIKTGVEVEERDRRNYGYDRNREGFKKTKTTKKPKKLRIIGYRKEMIEGKEVLVRITEPEREYFVGKTPPSGRPGHGTGRPENESWEVRTTERLLNRARRADEESVEGGWKLVQELLEDELEIEEGSKNGDDSEDQK